MSVTVSVVGPAASCRSPRRRATGGPWRPGTTRRAVAPAQRNEGLPGARSRIPKPWAKSGGAGSRRPDRDPASGLTPRQREILKLLADGHSAKEIARLLDISHRTVEYHKYQAMDALGVKTNAELIQLALRLQILPP